MEGELNTLIEQNNLLDKRFEIHEEEEDDFHSSIFSQMFPFSIHRFL